MKADLLDLLRQREIVFPTRIAAVEGGHRQLRVTIAGCPWWRETEMGERLQEEQIVLLFEGIQGLLDAETLLDWEYDEALESFEVSPLSEQRWANGLTSYSTYCSERLPDPLRLYSVVADYLWEAGAPRSPRDYLNVPHGTLASFCAITATTSYLLARAPEYLHQMISAELLRQNVRHNVLTEKGRPDDGLLVQLGASSFMCANATAEI
jgi:hypothetical protein